jgi:programmed cell death protein 5
VENVIVSMAMQGKLPERVSEGKLIEMLESIGARQANAASSKINIQRKRYAFDSDDDDDNDDDLM